MPGYGGYGPQTQKANAGTRKPMESAGKKGGRGYGMKAKKGKKK